MNFWHYVKKLIEPRPSISPSGRGGDQNEPSGHLKVLKLLTGAKPSRLPTRLLVDRPAALVGCRLSRPRGRRRGSRPGAIRCSRMDAIVGFGGHNGDIKAPTPPPRKSSRARKREGAIARRSQNKPGLRSIPYEKHINDTVRPMPQNMMIVFSVSLSSSTPEIRDIVFAIICQNSKSEIREIAELTYASLTRAANCDSTL